MVDATCGPGVGIKPRLRWPSAIIRGGTGTRVESPSRPVRSSHPNRLKRDWTCPLGTLPHAEEIPKKLNSSSSAELVTATAGRGRDGSSYSSSRHTAADIKWIWEASRDCCFVGVTGILLASTLIDALRLKGPGHGHQHVPARSPGLDTAVYPHPWTIGGLEPPPANSLQTLAADGGAKAESNRVKGAWPLALHKWPQKFGVQAAQRLPSLQAPSQAQARDASTHSDGFHCRSVRDEATAGQSLHCEVSERASQQAGYGSAVARPALEPDMLSCAHSPSTGTRNPGPEQVASDCIGASRSQSRLPKSKQAMCNALGTATALRPSATSGATMAAVPLEKLLQAAFTAALLRWLQSKCWKGPSRDKPQGPLTMGVLDGRPLDPSDQGHSRTAALVEACVSQSSPAEVVPQAGKERFTAQLARRRLQRIGLGLKTSLLLQSSPVVEATRQGPPHPPQPQPDQQQPSHVVASKGKLAPKDAAPSCTDGVVAQMNVAAGRSGVLGPLGLGVGMSGIARRSFTLLRDAVDEEPLPWLIPSATILPSEPADHVSVRRDCGDATLDGINPSMSPLPYTSLNPLPPTGEAPPDICAGSRDSPTFDSNPTHVQDAPPEACFRAGVPGDPSFPNPNLETPLEVMPPAGSQTLAFDCQPPLAGPPSHGSAESPLCAGPGLTSHRCSCLQPDYAMSRQPRPRPSFWSRSGRSMPEHVISWGHSLRTCTLERAPRRIGTASPAHALSCHSTYSQSMGLHRGGCHSLRVTSTHALPRLQESDRTAASPPALQPEVWMGSGTRGEFALPCLGDCPALLGQPGRRATYGAGGWAPAGGRTLFAPSTSASTDLPVCIAGLHACQPPVSWATTSASRHPSPAMQDGTTSLHMPPAYLELASSTFSTAAHAIESASPAGVPGLSACGRLAWLAAPSNMAPLPSNALHTGPRASSGVPNLGGAPGPLSPFLQEPGPTTWDLPGLKALELHSIGRQEGPPIVMKPPAVRSAKPSEDISGSCCDTSKPPALGESFCQTGVEAQGPCSQVMDQAASCKGPHTVGEFAQIIAVSEVIAGEAAVALQAPSNPLLWAGVGLSYKRDGRTRGFILGGPFQTHTPSVTPEKALAAAGNGSGGREGGAGGSGAGGGRPEKPSDDGSQPPWRREDRRQAMVLALLLFSLQFFELLAFGNGSATATAGPISPPPVGGMYQDEGLGVPALLWLPYRKGLIAAANGE